MFVTDEKIMNTIRWVKTFFGESPFSRKEYENIKKGDWANLDILVKRGLVKVVQVEYFEVKGKTTHYLVGKEDKIIKEVGRMSNDALLVLLEEGHSIKELPLRGKRHYYSIDPVALDNYYNEAREVITMYGIPNTLKQLNKYQAQLEEYNRILKLIP